MPKAQRLKHGFYLSVDGVDQVYTNTKTLAVHLQKAIGYEKEVQFRIYDKNDKHLFSTSERLDEAMIAKELAVLEHKIRVICESGLIVGAWKIKIL